MNIDTDMKIPRLYSCWHLSMHVSNLIINELLKTVLQNLLATGPTRMTLTNISNSFLGHKSKLQIKGALSTLVKIFII